MNRRQLLKSVFAFGAITILNPVNTIANVAGKVKQKKENILLDTKTLLAERKKARRRLRRVIMNNDGNDMSVSGNPNVTVDQFLEKRTKALVSSHVDSIFYCDGINNVYSHLSEITELPLDNEKAMNLIQVFKAQGTDTLTEMVKFCKQNNKEIFWSMRMNDNHDATRPQLLSKFKKTHPEYLVGKQGVQMPQMSNKWSALDYGVPEVRAQVERTIEDVVTRYNIDGIELDFCRHPALFKAQFSANDVTQEECDMLTTMIRNIRAICDKAAIKRGRVILIGVRVPDSLGFCKAIGIDLETWLKDELLDLMTGADYFKLEPWENWVALGRKYNVPAYAGLEQRRMVNEKTHPEKESAIEIWRGEAYMAWKAGVNGIYTFNRFNPKDQLFWEIGDTLRLQKLERIDQVSYVNLEGNTGYLKPEYWLKDGLKYLKEPK